jgi:hypothetical protein
MIESILDIATRDGAMETFICHPDREAHPVVLFLMDAPGIRNELYDLLHDEIRKTVADTGVAVAGPAR